MINSIIRAISVSLNNEFGDNYTIYTETVEQGLKEPCFFISCINPTNNLFLGKRYFRENMFCIQYLSADMYQIKEDCNNIAERLFSCLEYITLDRDLIRGTKMKYEIADGVLNFFINYNVFVYKTVESTTMEEMKENVKTKGVFK